MTPSRAFWLGIALTSPWGLGVEYDDDWFGRYDLIETRLTTVNLSPALAYRITEWLSIGGGLNIEYADAKLTNALPATLAPGGPSPATDGLVEAHRRRRGARVQRRRADQAVVPHPGRPALPLADHVTTSRASSGKEPRRPPLAGGNGRVDADTKLNEPDWPRSASRTSRSRAHAVRRGAVVQLEPFQRAAGDLADGRPDSVRKQGWKDTWSFYGGIEQRLFEHWTLRAGAGYEPTPTSTSSAAPRCPTATGCASASA